MMKLLFIVGGLLSVYSGYHIVLYFYKVQRYTEYGLGYLTGAFILLFVGLFMIYRGYKLSRKGE